MVKRGKISKDMFRISRPGIDVDEATQPSDFMLHENFLFAQPIWTGRVACPFAGYTGKNQRTATVSVNLPDSGNSVLRLLTFPEDRTGAILWPIPKSRASGNDQNGYPIDSWRVSSYISAPNVLSVTFSKSYDHLYSPNGAYIIVLRSAVA